MKKYNKKNLCFRQGRPIQGGPGSFKIKKSLGQNFLKSKIALDTIIKTGSLEKDDIILEIGPGKGALTSLLIENNAIVYAVEKDKELVEFLKGKFKKEIKNKKLFLIEKDILNFHIKDILINKKNNKYKLIANIPYNITGAILKKFLTENLQPQKMVLMVQYEVAKRIIGINQSNKNKESILSISVKAYGNPKYIMKVDKRYFSPAPSVDSAIICIDNISREFFLKNNINEDFFWKIIKEGFASKRKKISNNLKNLNSEAFEKYKNMRAEDLSAEDWVEIIKKI